MNKDINKAIEWLEKNQNVSVEEITTKWKVGDLDDYRENFYFEDDSELLEWINEQKEKMEIDEELEK